MLFKLRVQKLKYMRLMYLRDGLEAIFYFIEQEPTYVVERCVIVDGCMFYFDEGGSL